MLPSGFERRFTSKNCVFLPLTYRAKEWHSQNREDIVDIESPHHKTLLIRA